MKGAACGGALNRGNFLRRGDTFQYQNPCSACRTNVGRFVTCVKHEDGLVKSILDWHRTRSPNTINLLDFSSLRFRPGPSFGYSRQKTVRSPIPLENSCRRKSLFDAHWPECRGRRRHPFDGQRAQALKRSREPLQRLSALPPPFAASCRS